MKIAVCDDDELCRQDIANLLDTYSELHPEHEIEFFVFSNASELTNEVRKNGGADIYILDIIMPTTNGIKLGLWLRNTNCDGVIIFLTSSDEYALDSFKVHPLNYIIKPPREETMFPVLDTAIQTVISKKEKSMTVKTSEGNTVLSFDNIMYVELSNRCMVCHLTNGKSIESTTLRCSFSDATKELLADERFAACGASMIVNLLHITTAKTDMVTFRDGKTISMSKKLIAEIRTKWYEYWLGGQEDTL